MKLNKLIVFILILVFSRAMGQEMVVAKFSIGAASIKRSGTPVSVSLEGLNFNTDKGTLHLFEIKGKARVEVPCQLEAGNSPRLWWIPDGETATNIDRKFILIKDSTYVAKNVVTTEMNSRVLIIKNNKEKVVQYNIADVFPPDTVSELYKRSGFIHPLWSPSGNVMTRIMAPDHWHHLGIWNPYTKTHFEGHSTDFWNLLEGQGTVRFAGFNSLISGPVYGGFKARQEHVDFQCKGGDKVAMNEVWDVRVWNVGTYAGVKVWLWDLTSTLNCASSSPITLEAYRYGGGIGYRATDEWNASNSWVLTSEGKARKEADGTRARWCDVGGQFAGKGTSGILFMSHPSNREYPEPMRVWPEDSNKHGDLYFEFCPIRDKSWELKPGNDYVLKYRMLVYDGKIDAQIAEQIWKDFTNPPVVIIEK
ncbi:MAG: PmoA family protein [Mariniphaga sp.]